MAKWCWQYIQGGETLDDGGEGLIEDPWLGQMWCKINIDSNVARWYVFLHSETRRWLNGFSVFTSPSSYSCMILLLTLTEISVCMCTGLTPVMFLSKFTPCTTVLYYRLHGNEERVEAWERCWHFACMDAPKWNDGVCQMGYARAWHACIHGNNA
jgi:hypothetical protein